MTAPYWTDEKVRQVADWLVKDKPERELLTDPHGSRERMRNRFIAKVRELYPDFAGSLLERWTMDKALTVIVKDRDGKDKVITSPALNAALNTWARRWHLNEPWVIERARKVLERRRDLIVEMHFDKPTPWITSDWLSEAWGFDVAVMQISPRMSAEIIAATDTSQRAPSVATQRTFNPPPPDAWHPDVRNWKQYTQYITGYMNAILKEVKALGWEKPLAMHAAEHFEWLARFQVGGERYGAISRAEPRRVNRGKNNSNPVRRDHRVKAGVRSLAKDIGLQLRRLPDV